MTHETALLVIDVQVNMFDEAFPIFQGKLLLEKLCRLIGEARRNAVPVVYIQHDGGKGAPDEQGTRGWEIHPDLAPGEEDIVVEKNEPGGFSKTDIHQQLQAKNIKHLIVTGIQSEICVQTNCLNALELKYKVTLVEDAHSTFDSDRARASETIERINAELSDRVLLELADNIEFSKPL
jgi:nicotinamidase-related amidase